MSQVWSNLVKLKFETIFFFVIVKIIYTTFIYYIYLYNLKYLFNYIIISCTFVSCRVPMGKPKTDTIIVRVISCSCTFVFVYRSEERRVGKEC